jgi:3,4-dihydroxy 2-butanone 4-phosphate synthase/GTP cyclohydrolase II
VAATDLPTDFGDFQVRAFRSTLDDRAHIALVMGDVTADRPILVRVHRANFPADTFTFLEGRSRADVEGSLDLIAREGCGIFLYLNHEETGADLLASLSVVSQDLDPATHVERAMFLESRMTFRDFGVGAQILRHLGARRLRVVTGNPRRFSGLAGFGLVVEEFVPVPGVP